MVIEVNVTAVETGNIVFFTRVVTTDTEHLNEYKNVIEARAGLRRELAKLKRSRHCAFYFQYRTASLDKQPNSHTSYSEWFRNIVKDTEIEADILFPALYSTWLHENGVCSSEWDDIGMMNTFTQECERNGYEPIFDNMEDN